MDAFGGVSDELSPPLRVVVISHLSHSSHPSRHLALQSIKQVVTQQETTQPIAYMIRVVQS
ncbi:MAG: hypothetical protein ABS922_14860 [Psychrobacillus psychrotolerans]